MTKPEHSTGWHLVLQWRGPKGEFPKPKLLARLPSASPVAAIQAFLKRRGCADAYPQAWLTAVPCAKPKESESAA